MTEAEYIYIIEQLSLKIRNSYGNANVMLTCSLRIDQLTGALWRTHGKWYRNYTEKEREDLVAEHLLLGD